VHCIDLAAPAEPPPSYLRTLVSAHSRPPLDGDFDQIAAKKPRLNMLQAIGLRSVGSSSQGKYDFNAIGNILASLSARGSTAGKALQVSTSMHA
jgi:hypothetical protein